MRTWRLDLDSDAHAPRLARHSVRGWLEVVPCSDDTKVDVSIVVSELVTHAVTSGASSVSIRTVFDDGRLRIDVHAPHDAADAGSVAGGQVQRSTSQLLSDRMIEAATDAWGRTRTPDETHTWAEILC
jgi:hypothetical protein